MFYQQSAIPYVGLGVFSCRRWGSRSRWDYVPPVNETVLALPHDLFLKSCDYQVKLVGSPNVILCPVSEECIADNLLSG